MSVTAKVVCSVKTLQGEGTPYESYILNFSADYADGRNKEWAAATPYMYIQMSVKGDLKDLFEVGKKYTLTFDEAEEVSDAKE